MAYWGAGFSLAFEINRPVINLVIDKMLQAFKPQLSYSGNLGRIGKFEAEVNSIEILDIDDPPPLGGVLTDLLAEAQFELRLFGLRIARSNIEFKIFDVEVDLTQTAAGLPKGISLGILSSSRVSLAFPNAKFISGFILNRIIAPLVTFGIWLAFSLFRGKKIEIAVWELVDVFGALGIRYASNSPLLTAQKTVLPSSLLLGSDFNLTNATLGNPNNLSHFIPANTNVGAVVHEKVISAAVQIAFSKGWVPKRFKIKGWTIYINSIQVKFEQDKIRAIGSLKAKHGKCWCRVKVRIRFNAAVEPRVENATSNPEVAFDYDASVNAHISTSGMLAVLGVIMFAPVFLALTIALSYAINIILNQFLPFTTTWSQSGVNMDITAKSLHFSGFVPLSMRFQLQLFGSGSYNLSNYRKFDLPFGGPQIDVAYTPESISLQDQELRLAVELK
jgi:hypothetical protein